MGFKETYQYEDYGQFFDCPDGDLPVKILSAKETTAKSGNRMLEVNLLVDGAVNRTPYIERYVEGEYFNRNMSRFFDAFNIPRGNFNYQSWVNKSAVGHFEHKQESYQTASGEWKNVNRATMKYLLVNTEAQSEIQETPQNEIVNELRTALSTTFPDGQPVFSQAEINNYRQSHVNGTPLSTVLRVVNEELHKRLSITTQDQSLQSKGIDKALDNFIF